MSEILEENMETTGEEKPKIYVLLNEENGRNYFGGSWSTVEFLPNAVEVASLPPTDDMMKAKCHYLEDGAWVLDEERYNALCAKKETDREQVAVKKSIMSLEKALSKSDYKDIKCFEVIAVFLLEKYPELADMLPYDLKELCEEKQVMRDEINELEAQL